MQINPHIKATTTFLIVFLFLSPLPVYAKQDPIDNLITAYPDFLKGRDTDHLIWNDGERMRIDDGKSKSFKQLLDQPDIQDQFTWPYPTGHSSYAPPGFNVDPGRVRYEPLFKKMYGTTRAAVKKHLVRIKWMPKTSNKSVLITSVNGVDKKLSAISRELDALPKKLKKYADNIVGTYNWRTISGTKRLSAHSFGIAIDLNVGYAHYWKWDLKSKGKISYNNRIPREIVEIFERHGFIWGGKWYHYDTMHFEYRPELLVR